MNLLNPQRLLAIGKSNTVKMFIYSMVLIIMFNLNAVVDSILHPDIPYFDKEHIIVGGVTSLVSIILIILLITYIRYLDKALTKIQTLESFLPICAYCKKIRKEGSDPQKKESWQQIESYVAEISATKFSHGICPECYSKLYAAISEEMPKSKQDR